MKRTPSIVDALRRESVALRSAPVRDLAPAVEAALARERRIRRRRAGSLVACAALVALASLLPFRGGGAAPPVESPSSLAAGPPTPAWSLEPGRVLRLGGTWLSGLQAPLERELEGLTEDARKVAGAVARRLPGSIAARWGG